MKKPIENAGDTWTWTAIEADTKLLISWLVGGRDTEYGRLSARRQRAARQSRSANQRRPQSLSKAVEDAFGADVDYAMLIKLYGEPKTA